MSIKGHFDKNNLHHAYLIEGTDEESLPEITELVGGGELIHIKLDSFKIDDARNLKSYTSEKSLAHAQKKIFIISANSVLVEAQQALLKLFEEPIEDTHFFLITPDASALLSTFVSRFYRIKVPTRVGNAESFIKMPLAKRIEFLKELLAVEDEEDLSKDSPRSKALNFLNELESTLVSSMPLDTEALNQIFKVREFLRQPGSSTKSLMESVALMLKS